MKLPDFDMFLQQCSKREKTLHQQLENIYEQTIKHGFLLIEDNFGGHDLFMSQTRSTNKILPFPIGLLAPIEPRDDHKFDDTSTVASTEICQYPRLLAGSVSFVNSSCRPNCRNEFAFFHGKPAVEIKTIKELEVGEQLTIFYGTEFIVFLVKVLSKRYILPRTLSRNATKKFDQKSKRQQGKMHGGKEFICTDFSGIRLDFKNGEQFCFSMVLKLEDLLNDRSETNS